MGLELSGAGKGWRLPVSSKKNNKQAQRRGRGGGRQQLKEEDEGQLTAAATPDQHELVAAARSLRKTLAFANLVCFPLGAGSVGVAYEERTVPGQRRRIHSFGIKKKERTEI